MGNPVPVLGTITVDAADAVSLARWWADVLDGRVDDFPDAGACVVRAAALGGVDLSFQQVDVPTPGKNRIHLDMGHPDRAACVARLAEHGAEVLHEDEFQGLAWTTLCDPEGNRFCVSDT